MLEDPPRGEDQPLEQGSVLEKFFFWQKWFLWDNLKLHFMKFDPCHADDDSFADNDVNYDESDNKIPSKKKTNNGASQGQTRTTTAQRPPSRAGSAGEFVWF